ncbi:hypothetical protein ACFL12_01255, partial [Pseudomonadota bacterium]
VKAPLATLVRALHALKLGEHKTARDLMAEETGGVGKMMSPPLSAWSLVGEGDLAGALAALEPLKGNAAMVLFYDLHAGVIEELNGHPDKAEAHYLTLKKNTGTTVRAVELLGGLYERTGATEKALAVYREFAAISGEGQVMLDAAQKRIQDAKPLQLAIDTPKKGAAEALFGPA